MTLQTYLFRFGPIVPMNDVEDTLRLAILATAAIHGEADVAIDAAHEVESEQRICTIDGSTPSGRDLVRLFSSFLNREFGSRVFSVERIGPGRRQHQPARSA
jgi:hypothetical protein